MGFTQVETGGIKDDAISSGKIPDNAVGTSEIADGAVTLAKLADGDNDSDGKVLTSNDGSAPTFNTPTIEGTAVKSTGETNTSKFLGVDGDNTCSWKIPVGTTVVSADANGLAPQRPETNQSNVFLRGDATWATPPYQDLAGTDKGLLRQLPTTGSPPAYDTSKFLRGDGNWAEVVTSDFTGATTDPAAAGTAGLVPAPASGDGSKYLKGDGTWDTPTDTNTQVTVHDSASDGSTAAAISSNWAYDHDAATGNGAHVPTASNSDAGKYLKADGTWDTPNSYNLAEIGADGLLKELPTVTVNGVTSADTTKFIRGDNTWDTPPDTQYSVGDGGLTQNNFTDTLKSKLDGIDTGAEVNVQSDWNASSGDAQILNKPTIPTNTDTTYSISCVDGDNTDEEKIRLTAGGSGSGTDDVVLEAGTGLSIARSGDKITFTNTVTDTNTQLTTEEVQDIIGAMVAGNTETNISVTYDDTNGKLDFVSTDTNTTYSVQDGELSQNNFTDTLKSKLDGIDTGADVTDSTNVDSAGAVMNSDLDGKGEILIGDGTGDPTALAVGTNDYVLTADSNEATGVKWAAASGGSAGKEFFSITNTGTENGRWQGTHADISSLFDRMTIAFYTNGVAGTGTGTTLELEKTDGTSLGEKSIYHAGNDTTDYKLTTHYGPRALIMLQYDLEKDAFYAHDFFYTDTYKLRWQNDLENGASQIDGYQLLMEGIDGKMNPVTVGGVANSTNNTVQTAELRVGGLMLFYENSTNIGANSELARNEIYTSVYSTRMEHWNNRTSGWATANLPWYIVATMNANGNFVLDNSSTTAFLTQDLPENDDGKFYIMGGFMHDTWDAFRLQVDHPIYVYKDGKVRTYTGYASDADKLDGIEATSFLRSDADDTCSEKLTFSQTGAGKFIETPSGVTLGSVGTWSKDIIFGNCDQIRFTNTSNWNWNEWGGILYDHSATTMYIGGPAATEFDSNASPPPSNIDVDFVGLNASGLKKDGNTVWHAGNDGSGSGLDADKLDGVEGSAYITTGSQINAKLKDLSSVTIGEDKSSGDVALNLGAGANGDINVYLDITADTTYFDYGLRMIRKDGADGTSAWYHRGTGNFDIDGQDNGPIHLKRGGSTKLRTVSNGVYVYSTVTNVSDITLKDNIRPLENVLESIKQIRGVNFTWKEDGNNSIGVIAQEVETVFPDLVSEAEGVKGVNYSGLVGVLIEAVKELSDRVTALESGSGD